MWLIAIFSMQMFFEWRVDFGTHNNIRLWILIKTFCMNYKELHSHPSRWHGPIQCTEYSHHGKLSMFLPQCAKPRYRQWLMVAKVYINNLNLGSIIFGGAFRDSSPIPAIVFGKLSTTKHSRLNCQWEISFTGLTLINWDKNSMVSLEEPEIRWTSKCPRYCIVLFASATNAIFSGWRQVTAGSVSAFTGYILHLNSNFIQPYHT